MNRFLSSLILIIFFLSPQVTCEKIIPDFKQDDTRWADIMYSSHNDTSQTIKRNGCALCATANLISYWFDDTVTPIDMAMLSMKLGTCAYDGGTSPQFFAELSKQYSFSKYQYTIYIDNAIKCLNEGGLVIVSFVSGVWVEPLQRGRTAHACLIYSYSEDDGFRLRDSNWPPGVMSDIIGHSTYEKVKNAARAYYCFWK